MPFNIERFKGDGLNLGGARPSLFQVNIFLPGGGLQIDRSGDAIQKFEFMCHTASIPVDTVAAIDVPYFGRKIKVSGNRTYQDWNLTVYNDEDFLIRNLFEGWLQRLNHEVENVRQVVSSNPASYKGTARVKHYNQRGELLRSYRFVGLFPTEVDRIDLNWATENEIESFGLTLAYDYWELDNSSE